MYDFTQLCYATWYRIVRAVFEKLKKFEEKETKIKESAETIEIVWNTNIRKKVLRALQSIDFYSVILCNIESITPCTYDLRQCNYYASVFVIPNEETEIQKQ